MEPQRPLGDEQQANMGPTWVQKGIKKGSKGEALKKLKIELLPRRELRSAHKRAPQVDPQNWVAHRKQKNEARGAL